jgi:hypothetical protein
MADEATAADSAVSRIRAEIARVEQTGTSVTVVKLGPALLAELEKQMKDRYDRIRCSVDLEKRTIRGVRYEPSSDAGDHGIVAE